MLAMSASVRKRLSCLSDCEATRSAQKPPLGNQLRPTQPAQGCSAVAKPLTCKIHFLARKARPGLPGLQLT